MPLWTSLYCHCLSIHDIIRRVISASKSGARGRIHFEHVIEEDPRTQERKGGVGIELRTRRGMLDQRFVEETDPGKQAIVGLILGRGLPKQSEKGV